MKKPVDLTPIGFLLVPLLFIAAGLSIPYALVVLVFQRRREKRLKKRLSAVGRLSDWEPIRCKLEAGEGTLIVEEANKEGRRVWWTDDAVTESWHGEIPKFEVEYVAHDRSHPIVQWIVSRYLVGATHPARLVQSMPEQLLSDFGSVSDEFRLAFPRAQVVFTVLTPRLAIQS